MICHKPGGSAFLRLHLDAKYEGIVAESTAAIAATMPGGPVRRYDRDEQGVVILQSSGTLWLDAFPQHGPDKKHKRPIELAPWQAELAAGHPGQLLRGLIHSDGCRTTNRFSTLLPSGRLQHYQYTRYFFTNLSADIRRIFCHHCELLGIPWTQSNARNISVSGRRSVALLDSFVGPKT